MTTTQHTPPRIGIGISDFCELRTENLLFIDKSLFIEEILTAGAKILLIPRPRRFGKTLNLSMLRCFLELRQDTQTRQDAAVLFEGLAIRQSPVYAQHFVRYPVIFLTFKDIKETSLQRIQA